MLGASHQRAQIQLYVIGHPGPPPPPDDGLGELLGGFGEAPNLDWSISDIDAYKDKYLLSLKVPDIPSDAAGQKVGGARP